MVFEGEVELKVGLPGVVWIPIKRVVVQGELRERIAYVFGRP